MTERGIIRIDWGDRPLQEIGQSDLPAWRALSRSMQRFEETARPYSLHLTVHGRTLAGKAEIVLVLEQILRKLVNGLRHLENVAVSWDPATSGAGTELDLALLEGVLDDPSGITVVDVTGPSFWPQCQSAALSGEVRDRLASNVMARNDAEYAVGIFLERPDTVANRLDVLSCAVTHGETFLDDLNWEMNVRELRVGLLPASKGGEHLGARPRLAVGLHDGSRAISNCLTGLNQPGADVRGLNAIMRADLANCVSRLDTVSEIQPEDTRQHGRA